MVCGTVLYNVRNFPNGSDRWFRGKPLWEGIDANSRSTAYTNNVVWVMSLQDRTNSQPFNIIIGNSSFSKAETAKWRSQPTQSRKKSLDYFVKIEK